MRCALPVLLFWEGCLKSPPMQRAQCCSHGDSWLYCCPAGGVSFEKKTRCTWLRVDEGLCSHSCYRSVLSSLNPYQNTRTPARKCAEPKQLNHSWQETQHVYKKLRGSLKSKLKILFFIFHTSGKTSVCCFSVHFLSNQTYHKNGPHDPQRMIWHHQQDNVFSYPVKYL